MHGVQGGSVRAFSWRRAAVSMAEGLRWEVGVSRLNRAYAVSSGAPAVPDKCCFNFQMRRIKRDNVVACYPTSPECPHQAVM